MNDKLELLMPAWDFEKLKFAYAYWADACYVWVPMFSLRARTNGFTMEAIEEAVKYAHDLWKKIYFTANIYAHNIKIKPFLLQFAKMVKYKPDAFIMADPWLINIVRKQYPDIEIHLSVQANNTNWAQAEFWYELWIKRIILSREISIKEIKEIHEKVPKVELEAFVHWAICMAYSGRCLISNYLSNRDPNQGTCSHSCRWQYKVFKNNVGNDCHSSSSENDYNHSIPKEKYTELTWDYYLEEKERPWEFMEIDEDSYWTYLMNSRDLCAIDYLKDLKEAWVISFKVEWRNKTVNYLASVWLTYKEAKNKLEKDEEYDTKKLLEELFSISNRGYIPGFLAWNPWSKAQYYERNIWYKTKLFLWILRDYDKENKVVRVEVKNNFSVWDQIEIITPNWIINSKIEKILKTKINHWIEKAWTIFSEKIIFNKEHLEETNNAHGWWYEVWINMDKDYSKFGLIRKDI